jgi:hypothetical protein
MQPKNPTKTDIPCNNSQHFRFLGLGVVSNEPEPQPGGALIVFPPQILK